MEELPSISAKHENRILNLFLPEMRETARVTRQITSLKPQIERMALDAFLSSYLGIPEKRSTPYGGKDRDPYDGTDRRNPMEHWNKFSHLLKPVLEKAYDHPDYQNGIREYSHLRGTKNPRRVTQFVLKTSLQNVLRNIIRQAHRIGYEKRFEGKEI